MSAAVPMDRRGRRRQESIEQVLDVAADVMTDQGVAGLTLGEVARRMGIRPPSLYVYFDGKNALYDALFERGWRRLVDAMRAERDRRLGDVTPSDVLVYSTALVRWFVEHPGYAPLMMWRPVPGFTPSAQAYAPAVELQQLARELLEELQGAGILPADADLDLAFRTWTAVTSGVITQQLANAPDEPYETGAFTSTLPAVIAMWLAHHGERRSATSD